jgi:hypothetical protein
MGRPPSTTTTESSYVQLDRAEHARLGALAGRYTPTLTITDLCDETTHSAVGVVSVS